MGSNDLRTIFEHIISEASAGRHLHPIRMDRIMNLCEQGISSITHTTIETREPLWEEHPRSVHWMMERGVEGDFFNPHLENDECKAAGCRPAFPGEIPRTQNTTSPTVSDDDILRESGGEEPSDQLAAQQLRKYGRTGHDVLRKRTMTPAEYRSLFTNEPGEQ
jgi:hypothetical protein